MGLGFSTAETEKLITRASGWEKATMKKASMNPHSRGSMEVIWDRKRTKQQKEQLCHRERVGQSPPEALGKDKERTKLAAAPSSSPLPRLLCGAVTSWALLDQLQLLWEPGQGWGKPNNVQHF